METQTREQQDDAAVRIHDQTLIFYCQFSI